MQLNAPDYARQLPGQHRLGQDARDARLHANKQRAHAYEIPGLCHVHHFQRGARLLGRKAAAASGLVDGLRKVELLACSTSFHGGPHVLQASNLVSRQNCSLAMSDDKLSDCRARARSSAQRSSGMVVPCRMRVKMRTRACPDLQEENGSREVHDCAR